MSKLPKLPALNLPAIPLWVRTRRGMALTAAFVAALIAGVAGLAAFLGSETSAPPANLGKGLSVRDVRVAQFVPGRNNQVDAIIDMGWEKTGAPARDCFAQLMLKSGKLYRHGSRDTETVTLADEGQQQIAISLHFKFPR